MTVETVDLSAAVDPAMDSLTLAKLLTTVLGPLTNVDLWLDDVVTVVVELENVALLVLSARCCQHVD